MQRREACVWQHEGARQQVQVLFLMGWHVQAEWWPAQEASI